MHVLLYGLAGTALKALIVVCAATAIFASAIDLVWRLRAGSIPGKLKFMLFDVIWTVFVGGTFVWWLSLD